jgi:hypothetical protein
MERTRTVVALDIDGVLSPFEDVPGFEVHDLHIDVADVPKSPFVNGGGEKALDLQMRTSKMHARWISDLRERAEVVWATTWEDAANRVYAPLLGIDVIRVGISVEQNPPRFSQARSANSAEWKAMALAEEFEGRRLVWVDDSAWMYAGRGEGLYHGAEALVIAPDAAKGLVEAEMEMIDRFVNEES